MKTNSKNIDLKRAYYAMAGYDGESAEITMYGDIVEEAPRNWWTGEEIEGQYIIGHEFIDDLKKLKNCREITLRINSCGGDAGVSLLIHNRLRELAAKGVKLVCIVDGVAMSAATHLMCACDTVRVNPSSLIMIHKCWQFVCGGYNADELQSLAKENDAYDRSQISIYERKAGLGEEVLSRMLSETTYMTGREAVEKGFADEIMEDCEPLNIAASADGRVIFARGREIRLMPGMFAPDSIPTVSKKASEEDAAYKTQSEKNAEKQKTGGEKHMTEQELREKYPEIIANIEASVRSAADANAVKTAVEAERTRQMEIDAIATSIDSELVREAKYGEKACSAQELCYRAALESSAKGKKFLSSLGRDAEKSGAAGVKPTPSEPDTEKTNAEKMAEARTSAKQLLGKEGE